MEELKNSQTGRILEIEGLYFLISKNSGDKIVLTHLIPLNLEEILDKPITDFNFSVKVIKGLTLLGCKTLRDVIQKKESDFLSISRFGRKSLSELRDVIKKYKLQFAE